MPYAIEARFDPDLEAAVFGVWARLDAGAIATPNADGFRPHVSFALFPDVDEGALAPRLAALTAATPKLPVLLDTVSLFVSPGTHPGAEVIVFYAPVVTEALLAFHRRVHDDVLGGLAATDQRYRPGRWVPHCTLTRRIPRTKALVAVGEVLDALRPPVVGGLVAVSLVRYYPAEHRVGFALGGGP